MGAHWCTQKRNRSGKTVRQTARKAGAEMLRKLFASATVNTWMSLAVRMAGMVVLLPLVLTHFDVGRVLVWQVQASILTMLVWIDFGLSPTFSRFIAMTLGGATIGRLRQMAADGSHVDDARNVDLSVLVGTLVLVNAAMAAIGTLLVGGVGTLAIAGPIADLDTPAEGWIAWGLTAIGLPLMLLNGANAAVLIGSDRITTLRRIETLMGISQILTNCVAVAATSNIAVVAASNTFWAAVAFLANRHFAQLALRDAGATRGRPERDYAVLAWAAGWRSGVGMLFSTGLIQGSGMMMPQLATPETAAAYLLILRLITLASQISQAPFYSRLPAMTKTLSEGGRDATIRMAEAGMMLALWTLVLSLLALIFVAPPLLLLIGSSVQIPDPTLAIVMSLAFFAERYGAMHMQLYTLSNHVIWHRVNGLTGVVMVLICAALWPLLGPIAMPMALLLAYSGFLCPYISTRSMRFLQMRRSSLDRKTALLPLVTLLLCMSIAWVAG